MKLGFVFRYISPRRSQLLGLLIYMTIDIVLLLQTQLNKGESLKEKKHPIGLEEENLLMVLKLVPFRKGKMLERSPSKYGIQKN